MKERGCDWTGTVGGGIQHLRECGFFPILCPLKCVESDGERRVEVVRVERRQLAEHEREFCSQRELKCEFCGGAVRACEMNPHLGECEEFPVDCPNGCEAAGETGTRQMKRGAEPLHLAECPLQRVECPYREYGCGEEMERRQLDLHEREYMHTHFRLAMKEMKRKQIESTELKDSQIHQANNNINCLEKQIANTNLESISVKREIRELRALSSDMKQKQIESNDKIKRFEKSSVDKDLEIISAKEQIEELKALSNRKIELLEKQDTELKNEIKELKETFSTLVSTGHLEWKIKGIKQKTRGGNTSYSDPFYVGLYKCQGDIEWDCNNTGKVGCFIRIMKGEFDDKLKWPFIFRFKFVLLNQNRKEDDHIWSREVTKETLLRLPECLQKPTEIRNRGFGAASFISNTEILTEKYCKGDYISLHITVEQLPTF